MRFEEPDSRNRWDQPCFVIQQEDTEPPLEEIFNHLLHRQAPKVNEATINVKKRF